MTTIAAVRAAADQIGFATDRKTVRAARETLLSIDGPAPMIFEGETFRVTITPARRSAGFGRTQLVPQFRAARIAK